MAKNILVTGATGKQGGAVIDALVNNPSFTLLAVTRDGSGAGAQRLVAKGKNVKVVEGNLDDVPALFQTAQAVASGPVWGVYSVQISMGKDVTFDGEINQGKAMVDQSVKAGVQHFVYSSVERGGDEASWNDETPIPHFQTKHKIEHHLRDHAGTMGWTILRPVAFMDNLAPGFPSKVFLAAMRDTLGTKPCQWIATADIGIFAKLAFEDPTKFNHRAIGLAGDELNTQQLSQAFKNTTGSPLDGTFGILGSVLKYMVAEMGKMVDWFASDGYKVNISELRKMHPGLLNMEQWIVQKKLYIHGTIWTRRHALDIHKPVFRSIRVLRHRLSPLSKILHESVQIRLDAQIDRLLILADLPDLRAGGHIGGAEVVLVQALLDRALDLAVEDVLAQARFLRDGPREPDAVDGLQRGDHGADGLEAAGDVHLGLAERGRDQVGELEEEGLALLGALALVHERQALVRAAAELDEVEAVLLEQRAHLLGLVGAEAVVLELDAVELDGQDEVGVGARAHRLPDLEDEARAVLERAAVLVRAPVRAGREELGEQVAVGW
nr:nmra-like family domain-containing protein 1 [Quercus suber]